MAVGSTTDSTTAATAAASSIAAGTTSAADQQDRFMKLLVAQMRNQDPLNPIDNAQMTSQIAQINTVAGLEKLNKTVEGLASAFAAMQAQGATQLPGRSVLVEGSQLTLAEGQARGGVLLGARADTVSVEIVAADGRVVQTLDLGAMDAGVRSFRWDGATEAGAAAADGSYRMRITATAAGKLVTAVTLTAAQVRSVAPSAQGVQLELGALGRVAYGDVYAFL